jgi:hypothetical protein
VQRAPHPPEAPIQQQHIFERTPSQGHHAPNGAILHAQQRESPHVPTHCMRDGVLVTLDASWINDEYCDCDDGNDEPDTAACSVLGCAAVFSCGNVGSMHASLGADCRYPWVWGTMWRAGKTSHFKLCNGFTHL